MNWHEYFELDTVSGVLTWKARPRSHFRTLRGMNQTNAREAGSVVGTPHGTGYLQVRIRPKVYFVHRIIWEMVNGPIPQGMQVDHRDGNRRDNNPSNLRLATSTQNKWNTAPRHNITGMKGVTKHKGGYAARIHCNGVVHSLGVHQTPELAHRAYCDAALKLHGQFARTK